MKDGTWEDWEFMVDEARHLAEWDRERLARIEKMVDAEFERLQVLLATRRRTLSGTSKTRRQSRWTWRPSIALGWREENARWDEESVRAFQVWSWAACPHEDCPFATGTRDDVGLVEDEMYEHLKSEHEGRT